MNKLVRSDTAYGFRINLTPKGYEKNLNLV